MAEVKEDGTDAGEKDMEMSPTSQSPARGSTPTLVSTPTRVPTPTRVSTPTPSRGSTPTQEVVEPTVEDDVEKKRLEKEVADLEAEKERLEKQEVEQKARDLSRLLNDGQDMDSSEDDSDPTPKADEKPKVPFWDFAVRHLLVGLGNLVVEGDMMYCGSCQKDLDSDTLRSHLEGDGHKLNTLWNYDKSLAGVTGELRSYPQKFEMEMFKHITMLNRMEKRYDVPPEVEKAVRDLYKNEPKEDEKTNGSEPAITKPEIAPEELAEIKAEFIGSFPSADDAIIVQQALMGELNGYSSESSAQNALRIAGTLGKMICSYQRRSIDTGYKVNEECIRDIKDQCGKLLKLIDETRLQSQLNNPH